MRKSILKKISAVACAMVLTVASTSNVFAHNWESFWGGTSGIWYEGSYGETQNPSDTGFTAFYEMIGWGGVWGCQVSDNKSFLIPAGEEWNLKATITSKDIDKWIFIKITNDTEEEEAVLFGKWVHLTKGKAVNVDEKFTVERDANKIVFGMGGEFGDRMDEEEIYALSDTLPNDADGGIESDAYTTITVENFSLAADVPTTTTVPTTSGTDPVPPTTSGTDPVTDVPGSTAVVPGTTAVVESNGTTSYVVTDPNGGTVTTGDFAPLGFACVAVLAATVVVIATKKREDM